MRGELLVELCVSNQEYEVAKMDSSSEVCSKQARCAFGKSAYDLEEETLFNLEWLFQIEAEIPCSEITMRDMELEQEQTPGDKMEPAG